MKVFILVFSFWVSLGLGPIALGKSASKKSASKHVQIKFLYGSKLTKFQIPERRSPHKTKYEIAIQTDYGEELTNPINEEEMELVHKNLKALSTTASDDLSSCSRLYISISYPDQKYESRYCMNGPTAAAKIGTKLLSQITPASYF